MNFQTQLRHVVLRGKCVETCEKASIFKALRHLGATPKPWVAGSSPPAPAKKSQVNFDLAFFNDVFRTRNVVRTSCVMFSAKVMCASRVK